MKSIIDRLNDLERKIRGRKLPKIDSNFADDAAAATGGIKVGQAYHTNGVVKIRLS